MSRFRDSGALHFAGGESERSVPAFPCRCASVETEGGTMARTTDAAPPPPLAGAPALAQSSEESPGVCPLRRSEQVTT